MFIDFRTMDTNTIVESELCVIGAGAAGITIARELIGENLRVCLLEGGGFDFEAETQSLYEGQSIGLPLYPDRDDLYGSRLRYFGGTTNHWAGQCAPLSEIDFQPRSWVPHSGWPISKADLDPFYQRALSICDIGPYIFDKRVWEKMGMEQPPFNPEEIQSHFWQKSRGPTRFGTFYRDALKNAKNVKVLLHANVTNIGLDKTGARVKHVNIGSLNGKIGSVKAKLFVLACGGIENPRLLLISNQVQTEGLGNQYDLVGRFFMDQPHAPLGTLVMAEADHFLGTYNFKKFEDVRYKFGLRISERVQKQEQILHACGAFGPEEDAPPPAVEAGRHILHDLKGGRISEDLGEKIGRVFSDLDDSAAYVYCRLQGRGKMCTMNRWLDVRMEQNPNPSSRVTLSQDRDALGLNRLNLDWRLTELERRTAKVLAMIIGNEVGRLNMGRIRLPQWLVEDGDPGWAGGNHHMGTTRMSENPKMGVVNRDCRVHGINNLYIAGSSVFPTSGFVNPTLTIVALALRLVDHLRVV